jgi:(S)-ureidoglycine aminohydrolase
VGTIVPGDRGRRGLTYTLLTPANRYVSRLPSLPGAQYYKLVTPRMAPARFGQYLIVAGDERIKWDMPAGFEHFIFGLGGESAVAVAGERPGAEVGDGGRVALGEGGYLYAGLTRELTLTLAPGASVIMIKRRYESWPGTPEPGVVRGRLGALEATATAVPGLMRRELLDPANPAFDFNISHMEFGSGVALAQIEIHDEEHGLYMTSGGGLYHLDGDELEVSSDDFIYMAPYCPQSFRAGPQGGSYLLYKDVYRDGF